MSDGEMAVGALAPEMVVTPEATYTDGMVLIGADGRLGGVVARADVPSELEVVELPRRALLPGFVNAHSHVFQRRLRGRTHGGYADHDSFWTWREQMYAAAAELTPESLYALATACYREMLAAGYTTVGEFHYVHHQPDGTPYADPLAMSRALLDAATAAGIRLTLLPVAYVRGGFDRRAEERQRRFCFPDVEAYLAFVDALRAVVVDPRHTIGVAPHSVRAVPVDWLERIAAYAREHALVSHVHASEQTAEVRDTEEHHGCTPIGLLARHSVLGPDATIVHATHATAGDCRAIAEAGARVLVCPTTEGDLGDGVAPYAQFVEAGIELAIGSDGQTRIDPLEELRWAEFSARMLYQQRRVLAKGTASPGEQLLRAGTAGGAASLGLPTGRLEPGLWADLIAVDLDHPALQGVEPANVRDTLIFGAAAGVVTDVWVGGQWLDLQAP